ncbi:unnamed protein product, partial [marine sediment metagenome]
SSFKTFYNKIPDKELKEHFNGFSISTIITIFPALNNFLRRYN